MKTKGLPAPFIAMSIQNGLETRTALCLAKWSCLPVICGCRVASSLPYLQPPGVGLMRTSPNQPPSLFSECVILHTKATALNTTRLMKKSSSQDFVMQVYSLTLSGRPMPSGSTKKNGLKRRQHRSQTIAGVGVGGARYDVTKYEQCYQCFQDRQPVLKIVRYRCSRQGHWWTEEIEIGRNDVAGYEATTSGCTFCGETDLTSEMLDYDDLVLTNSQEDEEVGWECECGTEWTTYVESVPTYCPRCGRTDF